VSEKAAEPTPAPASPAQQSGSYFTGLLALLLAVAVFALLAQYSANQGLTAENQALQTELAATQAQLQASQEQMNSARDALGGLKDVLARIETLLVPPVAAGGDATGAEASPVETVVPE
jgi:type VI protein secretion system component VasK